MDKTNLHEEIFEAAINQLREKYYNPDNATAIPRDDLHWTYYKMIVDACARNVDHIPIWDTNLGDHIRSKMGTL